MVEIGFQGFVAVLGATLVSIGPWLGVYFAYAFG